MCAQFRRRTARRHRPRPLTQAHRVWRAAVLRRDGWTCDISGVVSTNNHAHHLNAYAWFPLQRCNLSNGITLTPHEHQLFHDYMGGIEQKCTRQDYDRYKPLRIRELTVLGV